MYSNKYLGTLTQQHNYWARRSTRGVKSPRINCYSIKNNNIKKTSAGPQYDELVKLRRYKWHVKIQEKCNVMRLTGTKQSSTEITSSIVVTRARNPISNCCSSMHVASGMRFAKPLVPSCHIGMWLILYHTSFWWLNISQQININHYQRSQGSICYTHTVTAWVNQIKRSRHIIANNIL